MNKEIEKIHEIITRNCGTSDSPMYCNECEYSGDEYSYPYCEQWRNAEALYNAGYRRIVWHKVADGDLPKGKCLVLIFYESEILGKHYTTDLFYMGRFVNHEEQVIAWTELPKYEGEEK